MASGYRNRRLEHQYIDGLVKERRNSIANALELRLSCTNPIDMAGLPYLI